MQLTTKHFGEININEQDIITFPDGVPAFEDEKRFIIINNPDEEIPFKWLQAVDDPALAFVIINPFLFKEDYDIKIPQFVIDKLDIKEPEDLMIYSIVVIPEDIAKITANLSAPIVLNIKNNKAKQVIIEDQRYSTKHYIMGEQKHVG